MTKYPVFRYDSFSLEKTPSRITARFRFSIPPVIAFTPEVLFEGVRDGWFHVPDDALNNVIFHLGLVEAFSYWKATASSVIEIHAGSLGEDQIQWWHDLLIHGMGEFFYRNNIDFTPDDFVRIIPMHAKQASQAYRIPTPERSLLTIGGGRDSALAAALLRDSGRPFTCMMLNPSAAAKEIARQVTSNDAVIIRRSICPELLELNRLG